MVDKFYVDADLRNADWTKKSWDLPTDVDGFLATVLDVKSFMKLPAAKAMPKSLRKSLEDRKLL